MIFNFTELIFRHFILNIIYFIRTSSIQSEAKNHVTSDEIRHFWGENIIYNLYENNSCHIN